MDIFGEGLFSDILWFEAFLGFCILRGHFWVWFLSFEIFLTLRDNFLVLFLSFENFGQMQKWSLDNFGKFCFWAHQNLDAPCCRSTRIGRDSLLKRIYSGLVDPTELRLNSGVRRPIQASSSTPGLILCSSYLLSTRNPVPRQHSTCLL